MLKSIARSLPRISEKKMDGLKNSPKISHIVFGSTANKAKKTTEYDENKKYVYEAGEVLVNHERRIVKAYEQSGDLGVDTYIRKVLKHFPKKLQQYENNGEASENQPASVESNQ